MEHANSAPTDRMNEDGEWDEEDGEGIEDPPNPGTQDVKPNLSDQNLKPPAKRENVAESSISSLPPASTESVKEKGDSTSTRSDKPDGPEAPSAKGGDESDDDKTVGIDPDTRKNANSGGESPVGNQKNGRKINLFGRVYDGDKVVERPTKTSKKRKKKKKKGAAELYIPKY